MLNYEQTKAVEKALGSQAAGPLIELFESFDKRLNEQKVEIKADLFMDLATKADISRLEGKVETEVAKLNGKIESEINRFDGKFARLEVLMKVLIGLTILAIALFSPAAAELVKLLK